MLSDCLSNVQVVSEMTIYIYGDSNTEGYDPFGFPDYMYPEDRVWTSILQRELGEDFRVVADGVCGRCIPDDGYPLDLLVRRIRREMPVDVFAVMLGTNDYLNSRDGSIRAVAEDMRLFVTRLREKFAEEGQSGATSGPTSDSQPAGSRPGGESGLPKIVIIIPPKIRIPGLFSMTFEEFDVAWHDAFSEVCEETGCIPANAVSLDLPLAADGVHLSLEGHRVLGESAAEFVRNLTV